MKYTLCIISTLFLLADSISAQTAPTEITSLNSSKLSEKILINNWSDAKTKYKWDWLETSMDEPTAYRYFSDNKLMVVCKAPEHTWAQADLPYNPLPAFWYYEASFTNVKGKAETPETGLLLKATSNGEEVKVFFVVNHFDQTYAFIQYNMAKHQWLHLNRLVGNTNNYSTAINKFEENKDFAYNKLRLERKGNNFLLYINDKLVETVVLYDPASDLNKLHGIGITGKGHQAYYVDKIKFAVFDSTAKNTTFVKKEVTSPEKKPTPVKEKITSGVNKKEEVFPIPPPLDKALSRERPVTLTGLDIFLVHNLNTDGIQKAKAAFKNKFREADFDEIAMRANIKNYPVALNTASKINTLPYPGGIYNAQGYIQGSFLLPFNGGGQIIYLVWMPAAENPVLTGDQLPPNGGDAFYFIAAQGAYPFNVKNNLYIPPTLELKSSSFIATMKEKHRKSYPDMIFHPNSRQDYDGFFAYEPLKEAGYTEEEIKRIFQLSNIQYKPQAIRDEQYEKLIEIYKQYKAYNILDFEESDGGMGLYWIPTEEAGNMPTKFQPLTDEGMFVFVRTSIEKTDYEMNSRVLANKPKGELDGIGYSTVLNKPKSVKEKPNPTNNNSIPYPSNENENKPVTDKLVTNKPAEKYTAAQLNKAEEKLINYLKQSDREFNPLAEKILKAGQDKWILYKTREKAIRIVDGQIDAINTFLRDYGDYTTPSFKADLNARLSIAEAARYKI